MPNFGIPYQNQYGNLYSGQSISNPMVGYQERMLQLQQQYGMPQQVQQMPQQYPQQVNLLQGKIVDSLDVVKATDIPMDGNCYYFPKADGTEVYAKRWLPTGKTEVVVYKPSIEEKADNTTMSEMPNQIYNDMMAKLNGIDERLGKMEKSLGNRGTQTSRSNKKEESE